jgi:ribonuclease HII
MDPMCNPFTDIQLIVDGDRFKPYCVFNEETESIMQIPHETIEKGDATYMGIAAASIIAKVEHDTYISDLCKQHPELNTRYGLEKNVGYGTKQHMDGIREFGITQWHRKSYSPCKDCIYSPL